jgi:hypothetical protein
MILNHLKTLINIPKVELLSILKESLNPLRGIDLIHNSFSKNKSNDLNNNSQPLELTSVTSTFPVNFIYSCINTEDPVETFKKMIPHDQDDDDSNFFRSVYLTLSIFVKDSIKQVIAENLFQKDLIIKSYNFHNQKTEKQYDNVKELVNYLSLSKRTDSLFQNTFKEKNSKSQNGNIGNEKNDGKKSYSQEIDEKIENLIVENRTIQKEDIKMLTKEIIELYEKIHFHEFGFIHNNKLNWTDEVRQFGFVIMYLDNKNILKGINLRKKIEFLKEKNVINFSETNWKSLHTICRNINSSDYINTKKISLIYSPNIDINKVSEIIQNLIAEKF